MNIKRTALFTLCLLLTSLPLFSAGNQEKAKDETVTLRVIESLTSPARTELIRTLCDQFEEANPGITVELISPPLKEADNKIAQMLMAKNQIDIVETREQTATQFINNGWIEPMDRFIESWDEYDSLSTTAKTSITRLGGKSYVIPYGFYQRCLYYRADWFEEAGFEAPKTWQEMYEIGTYFTNPEQNRYGYSFRGGAGGVNYADMLYWNYLGDAALASNEAAYFTADGGTIYSTPEAKEALEFHKALYEDISPKDSIQWAFSEMVQGFIGGTTAMLIQDPEVIVTCEDNMEEGTWATAPLPVGPSGESHFPNGYAGWSMTSFSEHKDEAWKLIAYLSGEYGNTYFAKNHSLIPIHSTAADADVFFKEGPFSVYLEMDKYPQTYIHTMSPQQYQAFGEYWVSADRWYQKYLAGTVTADEVLEYFDTFWSQALENEGRLF